MVTTTQQTSQSRSPAWLAVLFRTHNNTRTVDVALVSGGHRRDYLFGRRIDDVNRLAPGGVRPFAVDEQLLPDRIGQHHVRGSRFNHDATKDTKVLSLV